MTIQLYVSLIIYTDLYTINYPIYISMVRYGNETLERVTEVLSLSFYKQNKILVNELILIVL